MVGILRVTNDSIRAQRYRNVIAKGDTMNSAQQMQRDAGRTFYILLVEAFHIRHVLSLLPVEHMPTFQR